MSGIVYPVTNFQQPSGGSDPNPPPSANGDIIIDLDPEERCYNDYLTDTQCTDGDRVVRWFHTGAEPNGEWKMVGNLLASTRPLASYAVALTS